MYCVVRYDVELMVIVQIGMTLHPRLTAYVATPNWYKEGLALPQDRRAMSCKYICYLLLITFNGCDKEKSIIMSLFCRRNVS
jgi:hypothetical protein